MNFNLDKTPVNKINMNTTPVQLKAQLEQAYYQACIHFREQKTNAEINSSLEKMMAGILLLEKMYQSYEMYEHCAICRDVNNELAENLDLTISV